MVKQLNPYNHPPEVEFFDAGSSHYALDAVKYARTFKDNHPQQLAIWARRDFLPSKARGIEFDALVRAFERYAGSGNYKKSENQIDLDEPLQIAVDPVTTPFALEFYNAARKLSLSPDVSVNKFTSINYILPHTDIKNPQLHLQKSLMDKGALFEGRKFRSILTEPHDGLKTRSGTLCWFASGLDNILMDDFKSLFNEHGKQAALELITPYLTMDNAWQIRNGDVGFLPMGGGWGVEKALLHSTCTFTPQSENDYRLTYAQDMQFEL